MRWWVHSWIRSSGHEVQLEEVGPLGCDFEGSVLPLGTSPTPHSFGFLAAMNKQLLDFRSQLGPQSNGDGWLQMTMSRSFFFNLFASGILSQQQKVRLTYILATVHFLGSHGLSLKEAIQEPSSWPHTEKLTLRVAVSTSDKSSSTSRCYGQQRDPQNTQNAALRWKSCLAPRSERRTVHPHSSLITK